jgi:citrate lyase subunit beta/citryl-CoA lyase
MSIVAAIHPRKALFGADVHRPLLPVVDHYAGVEVRMRKSLSLQAEMSGHSGHALFDVTLDLEDGAPVGGEHEQALLVAELVNSPANAFGRVGVRVHDASHRRFEDDVDTLIRLAGNKLAYIMVPKMASADAAKRALGHIQMVRQQHGVTRHLPVHGLIETLGGLRGLMDFVSEHRGAIPATAMGAQGQFSHPLVLRAKLEISAACHAAGITPSHCVVTEFKDARALSHAAERASRELGYTRMWSIHPDQIPVIIEAFAPVVAEVDDAIEILTDGQAAHWAPISHRGKLHDRASYRHYWYVLDRAWLTGQPLPPEIVRTFFAH